MYVWIMNHDGEILVHRNRPAGQTRVSRPLPPSGAIWSCALNGSSTGSWLANLCGRAGLPFVLGHALYMKAIHGGKATHDTIDAHQIAVLLRGGLLPQAYVYPAAMRATRDLLRRRMHRIRQRAALLAHIQHTTSPYHLPEIGQKIAYQATRDGVVARFPDPAVRKNIEVDRTLIGHYDQLRRDMELSVLTTAKPHDANTRYLLRTVPGIGASVSLVLRYASHDIQRFPRVQDFVSYGRLVTWAKASAGKRDGTSGTKMGKADLTWAFSAAAGLCLRATPAGQQYLTRLEKKHSKGKAVTVLAQKLARAVDDLLKRHTAVDMPTFLRG
jgi:transposase